MDADRLDELIGQAQGGRAEAFDALVDAYSSRLYGYFYRLTRSRHDAEDLLQETFVRLVRTISSYRHDGRFDGWIFRIATNLVRDRVRRVKTARLTDADDGLVTDRPDNDAEQPHDRMDLAEQFDRLQRALDELPEPQREVILLRHFSDLPFREIAEMLGAPIGTVLARAHRGLKRLKELMTDDPA